LKYEEIKWKDLQILLSHFYKPLSNQDAKTGMYILPRENKRPRKFLSTSICASAIRQLHRPVLTCQNLDEEMAI